MHTHTCPLKSAHLACDPHTRTRTRTHVRACARARTYAHARTRIRTCAHTDAHTHIRKYAHAHPPTHPRKRMHTHAHTVYTHARTLARARTHTQQVVIILAGKRAHVLSLDIFSRSRSVLHRVPCAAVPRAHSRHSRLIVARAAGEAGALTAPTYRAFDHRHARTHTRAHTHTQQGVLDAQAGLHGQPRAHVPPLHDPGTHAHTNTRPSST